MKTTITINGKEVLLKDIQADIDMVSTAHFKDTFTFTASTVQGLVNKINLLINNIDVTHVDFEYTTDQVHQLVINKLKDDNVDKVCPSTYINMVNAFVKILNSSKI